MTSQSTFCRHAADAAVLLGLSLACLYATARLALPPRDTANGIAVVFSPWTPREAALNRAVEAGGRFVRFGGAPFVAVVVPDAPNYSSKIFSAGAWLVLDPAVLAACFGERPIDIVMK